jgi:predicted acyltransferase
VLFPLGVVLNGLGDFEWATLHVPSVLQRIAVCYLVAAVLFFTTG